MLANLTNLAHPTDRTLVLGVVLGSVKGALLECRSAVDGSVAGSAHLELGELVKLNLNSIIRVAFALRLSPLGLNVLLVIVKDYGM